MFSFRFNFLFLRTMHDRLNFARRLKFATRSYVILCKFNSLLRQFNNNFQFLDFGPLYLTYEGQRSRVNFFHTWYDNYVIQSAILWNGVPWRANRVKKAISKKVTLNRSNRSNRLISLAHNAMSKIAIINWIVFVIILCSLTLLKLITHQY